jgi:hypothetical protein
VGIVEDLPLLLQNVVGGEAILPALVEPLMTDLVDHAVLGSNIGYPVSRRELVPSTPVSSSDCR